MSQKGGGLKDRSLTPLCKPMSVTSFYIHFDPGFFFIKYKLFDAINPACVSFGVNLRS